MDDRKTTPMGMNRILTEKAINLLLDGYILREVVEELHYISLCTVGKINKKYVGNPKSKRRRHLSDKKVAKIKKLLATGMTTYEVSNEIGCRASMIYQIKIGKTYKT